VRPRLGSTNVEADLEAALVALGRMDEADAKLAAEERLKTYALLEDVLVERRVRFGGTSD
jgi:hypothetical protein